MLRFAVRARLGQGSSHFQNRNVTIAGNRIDDSFIYAIFVSNADGVRIIGNLIGQTFVRGSAFGAGQLYGVNPNSAVLIGRSKIAVAVDRTCDGGSVHVGTNTLI